MAHEYLASKSLKKDHTSKDDPNKKLQLDLKESYLSDNQTEVPMQQEDPNNKEKINYMPEMVMPQTTDMDPKTG